MCLHCECLHMWSNISFSSLLLVIAPEPHTSLWQCDCDDKRRRADTGWMAVMGLVEKWRRLVERMKKKGYITYCFPATQGSHLIASPRGRWKSKAGNHKYFQREKNVEKCSRFSNVLKWGVMDARGERLTSANERDMCWEKMEGEVDKKKTERLVKRR